MTMSNCSLSIADKFLYHCSSKKSNNPLHLSQIFPPHCLLDDGQQISKIAKKYITKQKKTLMMMKICMQLICICVIDEINIFADSIFDSLFCLRPFRLFRQQD